MQFQRKTNFVKRNTIPVNGNDNEDVTGQKVAKHSKKNINC